MGSVPFWEKLGDLRFRRIEVRIFEAVFVKGLSSASEIARDVGVARSTVFRHHQDIREIRKDYSEYIIYRFRAEVCVEESSGEFRKAMFLALGFMIRYRKVFEVMFQDGAEELANVIMSELRGKACGKYKFLNDDLAFSVFCWGVYVIFREWIRRGRMENEIGLVYNEIEGLMRSLKCGFEG